MLRQSALRSVPGILLLRSSSSFPLFSSQARPINCLSLLRVSSSSQRAAASLRNSSSGTTNTMGLKLIPAKNLHVSTPTWWLESRFHFSFAEYYNPQNTEFGVLRVLNDDLVKPRAGFGTHSHRDMEIFTYIIDGKLTHKDSIGTAETLGRGSVQYMSAGRGISHSEMNNGNEMLRFLQIWIKPKKSGLQPNYGSRIFDEKERHNQLQHVLTSFDKYESSKDLGEGVIPIHQDCNIYVAELDPSVEQEFILAKNRQAYLVCIEGSLTINDNTHLMARDATEITAEKDLDFHLKFTATEDTPAHFLMIEMSLA
ncbi:unnamed protein product [Sphagnum troendelagicum]|uniref:Pirin n=1 Tax=Sphagnum troendelagicum TaxID=128251 RepID=A0ABP0UNI9_9BRYO